MPCRVISNEPVSPTAFVLTIVTPITSLIETPNTTTTRDVLERAWAHGLWSLEFKQPQLQIARNYTPLPPLPDEEDAMTEEEKRMLKVGFCRLRFYMRRYDGGEVSTYLSRLQEGDEVEIRGPHLGFDIDARLGGDAGGKLVFLAGGTGIAPALQAATTVLQRRGDVDVDILWANRSSADCAGPIMRQLQALQAAYAQKGRTLRVQCVVDEEGSKVRPQDITRAISVGGRRATAAAAATSSTCSLHSQQQLEHSTEADDANRGPERRRCNCPSEEGGRGGAGKNLFMISGPDGFVGAYVGPKVWAEGAERQGRVGGVVANLMRKDPKTWEKWLVLKQ
ncbi:hypothetical protein M406DRAFT_246582 [Cryphonectria parasitica EP155]|uniref:FAD-binding FR-type domain-containing protein n=1 Tax=Cryphonectria parasitica (strain ATCC 38755 / EP155) TaxID=660469 RepID=A0A9P5CVC0_CRYP1|nr:uncharacterized protein M406DRAFT_246582 [Cryphonectria parasitica EP155]KAF3771006.1 hypothetical protein M406DRAFT_246582 [Cryphonectria parasitica EP155]